MFNKYKILLKLNVMKIYDIVLFMSDFMVEIVLITLSLVVYIRGVRKAELYKKNIYKSVYEIIKDLISNLTIQQLGTAKIYIYITYFTTLRLTPVFMFKSYKQLSFLRYFFLFSSHSLFLTMPVLTLVSVFTFYKKEGNKQLCGVTI